MTRLVATSNGAEIGSMDVDFGPTMLRDFILIQNQRGAMGYHTEPYTSDANRHTSTCDCEECW